MNSKGNWGGKRPGSGRLRQRLNFTVEQARLIRLLTRHRRDILNQPDLTEEDTVMSLVENAWHDLDEGYQEAAKLAEESH